MKQKKFVLTQGGNALFLILIAVALFAARSYAVTQTSRGSGGTGKEEGALRAGEILSYVGTLRQEIDRLIIMNGCNEDDISFVGFSSYNTVHPPGRPADGSCDMFGAAGGGLRAETLFPAAQSATETFKGYQVYSANNFTDLAWPGATNGFTADKLETYVAVRNLTLDVCNALNRGLERGWSTPPSPLCGTSHRPVYSALAGTDNCYDTAELRGLDSFCYRHAAPARYDFVAVLIAR